MLLQELKEQVFKLPPKIALHWSVSSLSPCKTNQFLSLTALVQFSECEVC
jgi:hypothetical protein